MSFHLQRSKRRLCDGNGSIDGKLGIGSLEAAFIRTRAETSRRGMWEEQSCDCARAHKASLCFAKYNPRGNTRENAEGSRQLRWKCRWWNRKCPTRRPTLSSSGSGWRWTEVDWFVSSDAVARWVGKRSLLVEMNEQSLELSSWQSGYPVKHGVPTTKHLRLSFGLQGHSQSSASIIPSSLTPADFLSSLAISINLLFALTLDILSVSWHLGVISLIYSPSLPLWWPNYFNPASLAFLSKLALSPWCPLAWSCPSWSLLKRSFHILTFRIAKLSNTAALATSVLSFLLLF